MKLTASEEQQTQRIDQFLAEFGEPKSSRSFWQHLCKNDLVTLNKEPVNRGSAKVRAGDTVEYSLPQQQPLPEELKPLVIYEDSDVIVVNKPAGLLVHTKGQTSTEATLADWLEPLVDFSGTNRGGIVHRLDRVTSGVIICARHPEALSYLQKQFANRTTKKQYRARVEGRLNQEHLIVKWPIERDPKNPKRFRIGENGKSAETEIKVLKQEARTADLLLLPKTGRTHQLRVHLSALEHPIVGDKLYGSKKEATNRILLHAWKLEITLPSSERREFTAPLPKEMA